MSSLEGATVLVTPTTGPDEEATTVLLESLRDGTSTIEDETGTTVGVTGLTAAREHTPDLVILDLGLPDADGFDVLARIRRQDAHDDRPAGRGVEADAGDVGGLQ